MEKKMISVHAVTIHIYTIIIAVLVIMLAFVGLKYLHLKFAVENFTEGAILLNSNQKPTGNISDYALIIGTTIANFPKGSTLITKPTELQSYVVSVSKELQKDVVVVDKSRKILADTVAGNVGTNYSFDANHEIDQTLKDGQSRSFIEKSTDYPNGITENVTAVKDATNQIVGVVLVSNTNITK